jgi:hypothetical protein
MADEKGRRHVKGMTVRGIILKTLLPIPLTTIPLTLAFSGKIPDRQYFGTCAMVTDFSPASGNRIRPKGMAHADAENAEKAFPRG